MLRHFYQHLANLAYINKSLIIINHKSIASSRLLALFFKTFSYPPRYPLIAVHNWLKLY